MTIILLYIVKLTILASTYVLEHLIFVFMCLSYFMSIVCIFQSFVNLHS